MTTTTTPQKFTLIESRSVERDYGFDGTEAVIDHPEHGRLLITDAYGGEGTMAGGCVRWRHGAAHKLQADDTLESLESERWNEGTNGLQAVLAQVDDSRPYLHWSGLVIASIAKSLGLD